MGIVIYSNSLKKKMRLNESNCLSLIFVFTRLGKKENVRIRPDEAFQFVKWVQTDSKKLEKMFYANNTNNIPDIKMKKLVEVGALKVNQMNVRIKVYVNR